MNDRRAPSRGKTPGGFLRRQEQSSEARRDRELQILRPVIPGFVWEYRLPTVSGAAKSTGMIL
ncbi:MAG: hypothetical protein IT539_10805 [Bradyrhizobiaceae bacterium]|nr:hypothetical protein [Bradyrhizobiaceae bacterium]